MAGLFRNNVSDEIVYFTKAKDAQKPCFEHAAESFLQTLKRNPGSEPEICKGCSKTMVSYIHLIQNMLDGLARKFSKDEDLACCVQCMRQESQDSGNLTPGENIEDSNHKIENLVNLNRIVDGEHETMAPVSTISELKDETKTNQSIVQDISSTVTSASDPKKARKVSSRRNSRRISREMKENGKEVVHDSCTNRNGWQTEFLYNVSSSVVPKFVPYNQQQDTDNLISEKSNSTQGEILVNHKENASSFYQRSRSNSLASSPHTPSSPTLFFGNFGPPSFTNSSELVCSKIAKIDDSDSFNHFITEGVSSYNKSGDYTLKPNNSSEQISNKANMNTDGFARSDYSASESNSKHSEADAGSFPQSDFSDTESLERKRVSTEISTDQSEKTDDRIMGQWRTVHDSNSSNVTSEDRKSSEAFVTICRNNAEALGCLVLGSSLLLSRTTRKLCVLVFDDVDSVFKEPLTSIFHTVQHVRDLKHIDERKLEYLKQTNLEKTCVWCFVQFSKCVFLNPDCLIIRNCDELFQCKELSAVPDVGWPDCFNAGVFVFTPSVETFSKLVELSRKHGQNNEGDQMLLNAYFDSWSSDISKKLSFIYNLMRNASYTYAPAFQRFGHNVKIVQFLGGSKPWEVKFFTQTGQLDGDVNIHPKHIRFFSEWINTFKIAVMKLFPQDVCTYAFNQTSISADDIGLALLNPTFSKVFHRNSAESCHILPKRHVVSPFYLATTPRKTAECNTSVPATVYSKVFSPHTVEATEKCIDISYNEPNAETENETFFNASPLSRCLPGADIGDFQGMKAWEQGHIDYEGCDCSENIMNRLSFLIHQSV